MWYGVLNFLDHLKSGRAIEELDTFKSPRFDLRISHCATGELSLNPPDGWTLEDSYRWTALQGFNTMRLQPWVLGDTADKVLARMKEHLPLAEKYGLDYLVFAKGFETFDIPPGAEGSVCDHGGIKGKTLCMRTKAGKATVRDWIETAVERCPRIKVMAWNFRDWSLLCDESCPRCADTSASRRTFEFLQWARDTVKEVKPDIKVVMRNWVFYPHEREEINQCLPEGVGLISKCANIGDEIYMPAYQYDDHYGPLERESIRRFGDRVILELPVGSCESFDTVIGFPMPETTAKRLNDAENWGLRNISSWWGSAGWVYNVNHEITRKAFFTPTPSPSDLSNQIAVRDFGQDLASRVVHLWERCQKAVLAWPFASWTQRFEMFTDRAYGNISQPALVPIHPTAFELALRDDRTLRVSSRSLKRLGTLEMEKTGLFKESAKEFVSDHLLHAYRDILKQIDGILDDARPMLEETDHQGLHDQVRNIGCFRVLFHAEYTFFYGIRLAWEKKNSDVRKTRYDCDARIAELASAEIENAHAWIRLLESDPNPNAAHARQRQAKEGESWKPLEIRRLNDKIGQMQTWLGEWESGKHRGIPYSPFVSLRIGWEGICFLPWTAEELDEVTVTDHVNITPWYSEDEARFFSFANKP